MSKASSLVCPEPRPISEGESHATLAAALRRAEAALKIGIDAESPLLSRLRSLAQRLAQEHLQLAVLGQFKRGKSTFINALLGAAVLPTGVIPLTALATFIAWRAAPLVVVRFSAGARSEEFFPQTPEEIRNVLFRFVAEEANPENRLGVERVELFFPADILSDGTVIIDTPGIGSTLRHNTEAALQVLPECDAALFVVSTDPPITEVELDYLLRVKSKTARIIFVLNKADYLDQDDKRRAVAFLQNVLREKALHDEGEPRIFCISAREALNAKQSGNEQALHVSGVAALEQHLVRVLAMEKTRWLDEAVRSKTADILAQASTEIDLRMRALTMPIEELAAKSDAFQEALQSIESERRIVRDLLAGQHRRLRDVLDARIERLRKETAAKIAGVIDASLAGAVLTVWEEAARRAISGTMQAEFEAAREPLVNAFAVDAGAALRGSEDRVNTLVNRVQQISAQIFDVPLAPSAGRQVFELGEDPYWVTETTAASLIPNPSRLIDRLLPATLRRPRMRTRMIRQADELIVRNGENLRWAILRGLDETFRGAASQFEERLDETITATRNVISDALARRRDRSFAIRPKLDSLSITKASLAMLRGELEDHGLQQADKMRES